MVTFTIQRALRDVRWRSWVAWLVSISRSGAERKLPRFRALRDKNERFTSSREATCPEFKKFSY